MATPQADEQDGTGDARSSVLSRHPAAIALGGGVAAAFGSSFIPMNAIEGFVTAYGIAELLPAAAPPLGDTARLALSAGIGTLTAGALVALLPRAESDDMGFESAIRQADDAGEDRSQPVAPVAKSGRLASWLRTLRFGKAEAAPGTITDFSDLAAPRIRNGDQHPDAPSRPPIRASADLGAPLTAHETDSAPPLELGEAMAVASPTPASAPVQPAPAPSLRFAPPPFAAPLIEPDDIAEPEASFETPVEPEPFIAEALVEGTDEPFAVEEPVRAIEPERPGIAEPMAPQPAPVEHRAQFAALPEAAPIDDLDALGVPELLERLEAGLARRRREAQTGRSAASVAEASAQVFALGKPPVAASDTSEAGGPFRLRLGDVPRFDDQGIAAGEPVEAELHAADTDGEAASFRSQPLWDEEVDYLPPALPDHGEEPIADNATAHEPAAIDTPSDEAPAAGATDDDMDAALRDALATLRQLSDRQRSS
jgi:hypothetical protein